MSTAHAEFLKTQERIHVEFLAHRQRLLEWLGEAGSHLQPAEDAPADEEAFPAWSPLSPTPSTSTPPAPASAPVLETKPEHRPVPAAAVAPPAKVERQSRAITWEDPLLDSHVAPFAAAFGALARLVTDPKGAPFGVLDCQIEGLGHLAGVDETLVTDLGEIPGGAFTLAATATRAGRDDRAVLAIRGTRSHHAASSQPHPRGPEAGATPAAHVPRTWTTKRKLNDRELGALYGGTDIFGTFGVGFERAGAHTRTPPLPGGILLRLSEMSGLDPEGGPWGMGTLSAKAVPGVGDPPLADNAGLHLGRLFQGAQQVLALFVMAAGGSIAHDGWRFEAVAGQPAHVRFFAIPAPGAALDFELCVESLEGEPFSRIVGDVKAWSDGQLVMTAERVSLQVVADFPLTSDRALYADGQADAKSGRFAASIDGFRLDYASMVAGAVGHPTEAFDQAGAFFETGDRQMPRLPGPPYHFVTRVTHVAGQRLSMKPGAEATMEYDVPVDAWYFDENGNRSMPWCVLLEAALQPCGWLSVYVGCPLTTSENVFFRNLDGAGKMTGEVFGGTTVRTHTKVTSVSSVSGVILVSYKIVCHVGDREVCNLTAAFGYFPNAALDAQVGLPTKPEQRTRLVVDAPVQFDLTERPEKYCEGPLRLPGPMLLMIDKVTGYWREEGPIGKGRLRVEKTVKPREWYFRSHFYSDPVQPGSLGVEQMLQSLQFYVLEENLHAGLERPYFEPLALNHHISWKFRGQVRPENKHIVSELDITSVEVTPEGVTVLANGSLWVDGVRCYEAKSIGIRVRPGRDVLALPPRVVDTTLDPEVDAWVTDHRPSYTVPVMPMMSMVDRLASAALDHVRRSYPRVDGAPEWVVTAGNDLKALGWLICDRKKRLRTEVRTVLSRAVHRTVEVDVFATLFDVADDGTAKRVASGRIRVARGYGKPPEAWPHLEDGAPTANPYTSGSIFWGPKLQVMRRLAFSGRGLSADLDAAGADAPVGVIHHILLDGALHGIPHDELELWSDKISPGHMGVPVRLTAQFFGPTPTKGIVRAEVRFAGFDGANAFPTYLIQMIGPDGRVWAVLRHVEMLIPFGHRSLTKADRIPFLVQRRYAAKTGLSEFHDDRTILRATEVKRMDGLPGSVAHVYGLDRDATIDHRVIAIKDHVGQRAKVHPGHVQVAPSLAEAWSDEDPAKRYRVTVEQDGADVTVRDASSR
jgi:3-hydroxymyristoyl/3-hydroxydecanoyl-(acyl carrier protein) dehydratase